MAARIGIFLAVILILAYLFAQYARHTSMFFPSRDGKWSAVDGHRDVWFNSRDGVRLNGWLFRARDPNAPLIVWCHGNAGNITDRAPTAAELARRGITVFLFDWRGYGRSEGHPSEDALYDDADEWARRAILNVAGMGRFSSDRTILEYARLIWNVRPLLP